MSGVRVPAPPPIPSSATRLRRVEPVLRRALSGPCALPRGSRLLVAVSGGADSTALLLGLHVLARAFDLPLSAAHLHHGLRGVEADGDLEFVTALCARLGVPLVSARWDIRERMKRRGLSGHAGMRVLRREFLNDTARRVEAAAIATAHTADDQLETVLMRMLRGSGLRGLGGMRPRHGVWIKPLLEATRRDLETDLRARAQHWREDRSNDDPRYLRSRIRRLAIPALLEALAPAGVRLEHARERLARRVGAAAREVRDAHLLVEAHVKRLLGRQNVGEGPRVSIPIAAIAAAPAAVQHALLRRLWLGVAPAGCGLTHAHLGALRALLTHPREGARVDLVAGRVACVESSELVLARTATACRAPGPERHRPADADRRRAPSVDGRRTARNGKLRRCVLKPR